MLASGWRPACPMASFREIDKRNGGCGVMLGYKLYLWGGETADKKSLLEELSDDSGGSEAEEEDECPAAAEDLVVEVVVTLPRPDDLEHPFDVFDMKTHSWSRQPTHGEVPSLGLGSSLVAHPESHSLYLHGGWNETRFSSDVYRVSTETWKWEIVPPVTDVKPSPRYLTGVLIHGDRLCMFGGVGPDIVSGQDPGATYVAYEVNGMVQPYGWNNEYYEFELKCGTWTAPLGADAHRPFPVCTFAFAKFDQRRAMMFGGFGSQGRMDEAFLFDLEERVWTGPITRSRPWPCPRAFSTLTALIDPEMVGRRLCGYGPVVEQRLLLLWGKDDEDHICKEEWILDIETFTWTLLNVDLKQRAWHITCPLYMHTSTECHVAIFGGNVHREGHCGERVSTGDLRILVFGVKSLVNCCLSAAVRSEEVMAALPSLPPTLQAQIKTTYEAYTNTPSVSTVTRVLS